MANNRIDAEASAQAQTLRHALGNVGGGRKAWETLDQPESSRSPYTNPRRTVASKRPRPKPHDLQLSHDQLQRADDTSADTTVEPSNQNLLGLETISISPSPQLAPIVTNQPDRHPLQAPVHVLPSPAPSEDTNLDNMSHPPQRNGSVRVEAPGARYRVSHDQRQSMSLNTAFTGGLDPNATRRKRQSEGNIIQAEKRIQIESSLGQPRTLETMRTGTANHTQPAQGHFQCSTIPDQPPIPPQRHSSLRLNHWSPSSQEAFPPPQGMQSPGQVASQTQGPPLQAQPPSAQIPLNPFALSPETAFPYPGRQVTAQQATPEQFGIFIQAESHSAIRQFKDTHAPNQLKPDDERRLEYLKQAVATLDWSYLIAHQYYCCLRYDFYSIPSSIRRQLKQNNEAVDYMMSEVLGSNENLSDEVLRFFATFPVPLKAIATNWPDEFQQEAHKLIKLITKSTYFVQLRENCDGRNFPPKSVFDHITKYLWKGLRSPQNQDLFLKYWEKAMEIFDQNQLQFHQWLIKSPIENVDIERVRAAEINYWGNWLLRLGDELQRHALGPRSPATSLLIHPHQEEQHQSVPYQRSSAPPTINIMPRPSNQSVSAHPNPRVYPLANGQLQGHPQQNPPIHSRLLPPAGRRLSLLREPSPFKHALHQAYLRSPTLRASDNVELGGYPLYQYVKNFAKAPARLAETSGVERWAFTVTTSQWLSLPKDIPGLAGAPATRILDDTKQIFRLRSIKWANDELPNDHEWAVADTSWIPYSYFTINGTCLEQRKKIHYGRDLPIDITSLVKKGDNLLDIAVMRTSDDKAYLDYLVAIEIVATTTHAAIKESCLSRNYISYSKRIQEIKQKLSAPSGGGGGGSDDDDIIVVESRCPIDLLDPLSMSKVCDIPVRGIVCTHYECFDLDTFLETRKRKGDGDATKPDRWQCPICKRDARPQHLMVDGFLETVRDELARKGLLDKTKTITIASDGTWEPKVEDNHNGVADPDDSEDSQPRRRPKSLPSHVEVIELSD